MKIRSSLRAVVLAIAAMSALAPVASAQAPSGYPVLVGPDGHYMNPAPVFRPGAAYTETTVAVAAGTWTLVIAAPGAQQLRQKVILGDATGLGCAWSTSSTPVAGQGFAFSQSGAGGSWVFDDPTPNNAVYVKCATAGVVTVGAA